MEKAMKMDNELPKRKGVRLKRYDYSSKSAYFITICIQDRKRMLSDIVKPKVKPTIKLNDRLNI